MTDNITSGLTFTPYTTRWGTEHEHHVIREHPEGEPVTVLTLNLKSRWEVQEGYLVQARWLKTAPHRGTYLGYTIRKGLDKPRTTKEASKDDLVLIYEGHGLDLQTIPIKRVQGSLKCRYNGASTAETNYLRIKHHEGKIENLRQSIERIPEQVALNGHPIVDTSLLVTANAKSWLEAHEQNLAAAPKLTPAEWQAVEQVQAMRADKKREEKRKQTQEKRDRRKKMKLQAIARRLQEQGNLPSNLTNCAVCGKELTDSTSIKRGIGPECWERVLVEIEGQK